MTLRTTKHAQLGELEFIITCQDRTGNTKIVEVGPAAEVGRYYLFGPVYTNYSTNRVQAKLKYSPASVIKHPKVEVVMNQKGNITIQGNYDLRETLINVN